MKKKGIGVRVHFINRREGGWRDLPESIDRYACTAKFPDIGKEKRQASWSLVIDVDEYDIETGEVIGEARFLATDVPDEIKETNRFELYEGPRFVGHGIFL